ncbi:hypothetical protein [Lacimicrobium alkaliphilum]|uniref:Phosphate ABC transporter substrate-binding protein n=1 Tax=Lacimicrobium alkaliphilum TaxID=1526571 RepID=A0A0U2QML5_9ALTE|nr:hypothetical protein [Lacimicrobium alkaliphilum]ALS98715.1 hypothetical protein AT746_10825 [Lacimicrobium alkaliphilum]
MKFAAIIPVFILSLTMPVQDARASEEFVVVVNPQNPTSKINKNELIDIYMGKRTAFPGGSKAFPLDFEMNSKLRTGFYQSLLGIPVARVNAYWSRIRFSGKVSPPMTHADLPSVLDYVANNTMAIAYIPKSAITDNVKVVYRLYE